ncbi:cupin domain-containing protein [Bradyrhizobium sp. dw_78]|uniref:cupin domain-containing protein n=1 Tax=Bradyrhizobium sp. dw_78 TaxID=2719793 RepID=UPI001BD30D5E|nr:cupin domain-containing protein [Bradyrhizobium sp. dw_78]
MSNATFVGQEEQSKNFTVSSRRWVAHGSDVFVKEFTLAKGEEVPWHTHTEVFDIFYCLQGSLRIERMDRVGGERIPDFELQVGDSAKVEVGTVHRPFNPGPGVCRFLIVQGVGAYDYVPYKPAS